MSLSRRQIDTLLKPIKPSRVFQANGQAHVPAYDVAAHLTRIFGFGGWDKQILSLLLVAETENNGKWTVTYSCTMRLTIKDADGQKIATWDDGACGTGINQPQRGEAHDLAMKSAISYAMKRCAAFGLGDQFGLGLYNKGATGKLIGVTLVDGAPGDVDVEAHVPVPQSLGNDERHVDEEPLTAEQVAEKFASSSSFTSAPDPYAAGKAKAVAIKNQIKVDHKHAVGPSGVCWCGSTHSWERAKGTQIDRSGAARGVLCPTCGSEGSDMVLETDEGATDMLCGDEWHDG